MKIEAKPISGLETGQFPNSYVEPDGASVDNVTFAWMYYRTSGQARSAAFETLQPLIVLQSMDR